MQHIGIALGISVSEMFDFTRARHRWWLFASQARRKKPPPMPPVKSNISECLNFNCGHYILKLFSLTFFILVFIGLSIPSTTIAATGSFPNGCKPVGFSFKYYVLMLHPNAAGNSHSLYFIYNKSKKPVQFYQMRSGEEPYIMHINNKIQAQQWGAYATDEDQARFICAIPKANKSYGQVVNCQDVLNVCEYTNVKFSINNYGNYWAVSSNSRSKTIRSVISQGILLRW